jgi:hypothetical protein
MTTLADALAAIPGYNKYKILDWACMTSNVKLSFEGLGYCICFIILFSLAGVFDGSLISLL